MIEIASHNDLLSAYGQSIGLHDVSFDDDGEALLIFDQHVVRFVFDDDKKMILLTAPVINKPIEHNIDVYANLLELNLTGILYGAGAVGLDREDNMLIFANSISVIGLEQERFNAFVASNVDLIDGWRKLVESEEFPHVSEDETSLNQQLVSDGIVPTRV